MNNCDLCMEYNSDDPEWDVNLAMPDHWLCDDCCERLAEFELEQVAEYRASLNNLEQMWKL